MDAIKQPAHPTMLELIDYIMEPEDPQCLSLRWHVGQCSQCRQRVEKIESTMSAVQEIPTQALDVDAVIPPHLTINIIEQYIQLPINDSRRQTWQHHIDECDWCLERVLATRATYNSDPESAIKPIAGVWQAGFDLLQRVPKTAAASIFLLAVLIGVLVGRYPTSSQWTVASYRDQPQLKLLNNDSGGIGFFNEVDVTWEPFSPVKIEVANEMLQFRWPEIKEAMGYTLTIGLITQNEETTLATKTVNTTTARLQLQRIEGARYTWKLIGNTATGQRFQAKGGFVLTQN